MTLAVRLRAPKPDDLAFLMSSWLRSHRDEGANRWMTNDVYFGIYRPRFTAALRQFVLIACNPDDEDQIFGWVCAGFGGHVVHYVYVKRLFRRMGVCKRLLEKATSPGVPFVATHTGHVFEALRSALGCTYDPTRLEAP